MEKLSNGRSMVVAYLNTTYEAYVVEFDIQSKMKCTIYGTFGNTGYPTHIKHDIAIKTKGLNQIMQQKPTDLPITFNNQKLQMTVYNTKLAIGGVMDPLVLTLSCEGWQIVTRLIFHHFLYFDTIFIQYYENNLTNRSFNLSIVDNNIYVVESEIIKVKN